MADKIKAFTTYGPRLKLGKTVQMEELVTQIAGRTGLNRGSIRMVLDELHDAVLQFNRTGRAVKLEGLGIYTPGVKLNGSYEINHRLDRELKRRLNDAGTYVGEVLNRDMMGKTMEELITLWNEEHPDDLIE